MAKNARDQKSPAARGDKPRKPSGELKSGDLDKVVGGLKATGGPRPKGGDPCDGGE
jgi:hypothetical protein